MEVLLYPCHVLFTLYTLYYQYYQSIFLALSLVNCVTETIVKDNPITHIIYCVDYVVPFVMTIIM